MVFDQKLPFFHLFFCPQYSLGKCPLRQSRTKKHLSRLTKKEVQKNRKIDSFLKGVNPWFWSKNGHFSNLFFQAIQTTKTSFTIFQNEKTPFQAIKKEVQKVEKLTFFQKGEPMVLEKKWPFFQHIFFRQYRPGKCLLRYSTTKKHVSRL